MSVRVAVVDDLAAIVGLLNQLSLGGVVREGADHTTYRSAFEEIARDERQTLLVADDADGRVVGTASLIFIPNLSHRGQRVAQLESVVVDEAARGRGVGVALVADCLRRAREAGCFRVQLTSNNARSDAHRFWRRCGFVHSHAGFKLLL